MAMPNEYFIFISYSRKDSARVRYLYRRLKKFRFPVKLVKKPFLPPHDKYTRPIFLDREELGYARDVSYDNGKVKTAPKHYEEELHVALERSRYLVVVCSPDSAKSEAVKREIEYFLATHNGDKSLIVPVLLDNVSKCLPEPIREKFYRDTNLPSMVEDEKGESRIAWDRGVTGVLSTILQVDKDQIKKSIDIEDRRRRRVISSIVFTAMVICLCLTAWALYAERIAEIQRNRAETTLAVSDFQEASRLIDDQKDVSSAMVWLGGSLTNVYCTPAAQRLYELLSQRSWLVERETVSEEFFEETRQKYQARMDEIAKTTEKYSIKMTKADGVKGKHTWEITLPTLEGNADAEKRTIEVIAMDKPELYPSPNGEYLYIKGQKDTTHFLRLYSISNAEMQNEMNFTSEYPIEMKISPDGIHLAVMVNPLVPTGKNRILVLDSYSFEPIMEIPTEDDMLSRVEFSHDSRMLAVLQNHRDLQIFNLWTRSPLTENKRIAPARRGALFTPDDRKVIAQGWDDVCYAYEIQASPLAPREYRIETGTVLHACTLIPDTETLLLWSWVGNYQIWINSYDFATGKSTSLRKLPLKIDGKETQCVGDTFFKPVFDAECSRMSMVAEVEGKPKWISFKVSKDSITDVRTWNFEMALDLPGMYTNAVVSPDHRYLILSNSRDKNVPSVKMYDFVAKKWVEEVQVEQSSYNAKFNSTGELLVVSALGDTSVWKKSAEKWSKMDFSKTPEIQKILKGYWIHIEFSSQGQLALSGKSGYALLNIEEKRIILNEQASRGTVTLPCALSEDGRLVAFAVSEKKAVVYDSRTGKPVTEELEHPYCVQNMQFLTSENQTILCCNSSTDSHISAEEGTQYRGTIVLWDITTKRRIIDHIPLDDDVNFVKMTSTEVPKLVYASSKNVFMTDILSISEPTTEEEKQTLKRLIPLLCCKYGGMTLNQYRAPEFDLKNALNFDEFCRSLTEEQKNFPQVKKWLELDQWISLSAEKRTVAPGKKEELLPWLTQFAESESGRCLQIDPSMPKALDSWIWSQIIQIAEEDYIYGVDNTKQFSELTTEREMAFTALRVANPSIYYDNPRARYYADFMSKIALERCPNDWDILQTRSKILSNLGRKEEAKELNAKILELIK